MIPALEEIIGFGRMMVQVVAGKVLQIQVIRQEQLELRELALSGLLIITLLVGNNLIHLHKLLEWQRQQ
jgi:hypothetical protein